MQQLTHCDSKRYYLARLSLAILFVFAFSFLMHSEKAEAVPSIQFPADEIQKVVTNSDGNITVEVKISGDGFPTLETEYVVKKGQSVDLEFGLIPPGNNRLITITAKNTKGDSSTIKAVIDQVLAGSTVDSPVINPTTTKAADVAAEVAKSLGKKLSELSKDSLDLIRATVSTSLSSSVADLTKIVLNKLNKPNISKVIYVVQNDNPGVITVTATGTNLANISQIKIVNTTTSAQIIGTIVTKTPTQITATFNGAFNANDTFDIVITDIDGTVTQNTNGVRILAAPTAASISPLSGYNNSKTAVTVTGDNFTSETVVALRKVGDTQLNQLQDIAVTVNNTGSDTIKANVPSGLAMGQYDVVVINIDNKQAVLPAQFDVMQPAPSVTTVTPAFGAANTTIYISGSNFLGGAQVTLTNTSRTITLTGVIYIGPTSLEATVPPTVSASDVGVYDVVITNPDTQSGKLAKCFSVIDPTVAPSVTSLDVTTGYTESTTNVVITGTNFQGGATVKIGDTKIDQVSVQNATTINIIVPKGLKEGKYDIVVTNPDGQFSTLASAFTVAVQPPDIMGITPGFGPNNKDTLIKITGNYFTTGVAVKIGNTSAKEVTLVDSSTITAKVPLGLFPGNYDVMVTNADGQTDVMVDGYKATYPVPTISTITPAKGPNDTVTSITIAGTNFVNGAIVKIGDKDAQNVNVVDATKITADVPTGILPGNYNVYVILPDDTMATKSAGYAVTYPIPTITAVTPNSGLNATPTDIAIDGTNFQIGATVKLGTNAIAQPVVQNSTRIAVTIPAGLAGGQYDVIVTNPDNQQATLTKGYTATMNAPTVTSVSPNSAANNVSTRITVAGTNFAPGATVKVGNAVCQGVTVVSATSITATLPSGLFPQQYNVVVTNVDNQQGTLVNGFTARLPAPDVQTVTPNKGPNNVNYDITITGSYFTQSAAVKIGTTDAINVTVVSANTIKATVPLGMAVGYKDVTVINSDSQSDILTNGYQVMLPAPIINTVNGVVPASGVNISSTSVQINGDNFVAGATVKIGTSILTGALVVNAQTITVTIPANYTAGKYSITVTNPDGQTLTSANAFTVTLPAPVISGQGATPPGLAPTVGANNVATRLTINGAYFVQGATVKIGNTPAASVTYQNATQLGATVPVGLFPGNYNVTVTNPDGQAVTAAAQFTVTYPAPVITTVTPASGPNNGATIVTITGNYFQNGLSLSIGGNPIATLTVDSSTKITATVPAGLPIDTNGYDVTVTNPDAQTVTKTNAYIVYDPTAAPTIATITPNVVTNNVQTPVAITGTNFVSGAVVKIGTQSITDVTVNGPTSLTVNVPAGITPATYDLSIVSPDTQTATSVNGMVVRLPAPTITGIAPAKMANNLPISLAVTGTNFVKGASVFVGTTSATVVNVTTGTSLNATIPSGIAPGTYNIKVVNPDGQSVTYSSFAVTLPAPVITTLSPAKVANDASYDVTVSGSYFVQGVTAMVGTTPATVAYVSDKSLVVTVPAGIAAGTYNFVLTNPDGQIFNKTSGIQITLPAPQISGISPASGLNTTDTIVTIDGQNFVAGATVKIGTTALTNVILLSAQQLRATVPAGILYGTYNVTVTNPDRQSATMANGFTVILPAPTITTVTPNTGPNYAITPITITGTNFLQNATVSIGANQLSNVVYSSSTKLTAKVPTGIQPGVYTLTVKNPDNQVASLPGGYTVTLSNPIITKVTPNNGTNDVNTSITIDGADFLSGAIVKVGQISVSNVTVSSLNKITATVPAGITPGLYDISVKNTDGVTAVMNNAYTVKPALPTIASVTPEAIPNNATTVLAVSGTNFIAGLQVTVGGMPMAANVVSSTQMNVTIPAGTLVINNVGYDLVVSNPTYAQTVTKSAAVVVYDPTPSPVITTITPTSGINTSTTNIAISGSNFIKGAIIRIGTNDTVNTIVNAAGNSITCTVPAGITAGHYIVSVTNPDGKIVTYNGFDVMSPAPVVLSVSPNKVANDIDRVITITGSNFQTGAAVNVGSVAATNVVVNSPIQITATVPLGTTPGVYTVTVTNPDTQSGSKASVLTVVLPAPTITTVNGSNGTTPAVIANDIDNTVVIIGANFVNGVKVKVGTVELTGVTLIDPSTINIVVPKGFTPNLYTVTVTNPDNQYAIKTSVLKVTLPAPTVSTVSPSSGPNNKATTITINGANFVAGASVKIGSIYAINPVVSSSKTSITAVVPAGLAVANYNIQVINPDGQIGTLTNGYRVTLPAPIVTSISPNQGLVGASTNVVITGENFAPGAIVKIGNLNATAVVVKGSTSIEATVTPTVAGIYDITVINTDNQQGILLGGFVSKAP